MLRTMSSFYAGWNKVVLMDFFKPQLCIKMDKALCVMAFISLEQKKRRFDVMKFEITF